MKKIVLGLLLALSACGSGNAPDGYKFEKREFFHPSVEVTVVEHSSLADLQKSYVAEGNTISKDRELQAYSYINPTNNKCRIHIVNPKSSYNPEFIGHEFVHCLYGRFHS